MAFARQVVLVGDQSDRRDGALAVRKILHLRWSYDERIDDGLSSRYGMDAVKRVLEDPERWLTPEAPLSHRPAD